MLRCDKIQIYLDFQQSKLAHRVTYIYDLTLKVLFTLQENKDVFEINTFPQPRHFASVS